MNSYYSYVLMRRAMGWEEEAEGHASSVSELENLEIDTRSCSSGTTSLIMCMEDLLNEEEQ